VIRAHTLQINIELSVGETNSLFTDFPTLLDEENTQIAKKIDSQADTILTYSGPSPAEYIGTLKDTSVLVFIIFFT